MTPTEYLSNVLVTESRDFSPLQERFAKVRNIRLLHGAIGLASEFSELLEMASKISIDPVNLKEEIGDLYWYMGIMVSELQLDPNVIFGATPYLERSGYEHKLESLDGELTNIGIAIGKAVDLLKKSVMYGKELNVQALTNQLIEIGLASEVCLNLYGLTGEMSRIRNIEKLRARYGDKFTEAAALNRDLKTEREILEKN